MLLTWEEGVLLTWEEGVLLTWKEGVHLTWGERGGGLTQHLLLYDKHTVRTYIGSSDKTKCEFQIFLIVVARTKFARKRDAFREQFL